LNLVVMSSGTGLDLTVDGLFLELVFVKEI
jgi:hypothetical protein